MAETSKTPIQIYQDALYKATHDYISSSKKDDCEEEVTALLGCLALYTHKVINTTFKEDKYFHNAAQQYIKNLSLLCQNRTGSANELRMLADELLRIAEILEKKKDE